MILNRGNQLKRFVMTVEEEEQLCAKVLSRCCVQTATYIVIQLRYLFVHMVIYVSCT